MKNIFKNTTPPTRTQIEINDLNGHDAERLAAANLTLALNARISWASRKEDNSKIDLIVTMLHPWEKNKAEVILTQVKSGQTFGQKITDGKQSFKIIKSKFEIFLKQKHHSLITWIDREDNEIYWCIIKANSSFFRTVYGLTHKLSPATRFDILRITNSFEDRNGGKGILFSAISEPTPVPHYKYSDVQYRPIYDKAKLKYKELKRKAIIRSDIFGDIEITNYGWRHMTREARWSEFKVASYEIIPLLEHILKKSPSKHFIQNQSEEDDKDYCYRKVEYLLEYDNIKRKDPKTNEEHSVKAYIKLIESIKYPRNWKFNSQLTQKIYRRVFFKSIYYKENRSS